MTKTDIVCDYDGRAHGPRIQGREPVVYISADRRFGNVYLQTEKVERALGIQLDSVSLDLCELAAFIYMADKAVPRGRFEKWTRNLSFLVPVRNVDRWNMVKEILTNTVATLSGDNIDFHFVNKVEEKRGGKVPDSAPTVKPPESDCTCLFSGGLDSFSGAVYLIKQGRRPLFASHYVSALKGLQSDLMAAVQKEFGRQFHHFQYRVTSRPNPRAPHPYKARESSHRARSFLFLSFATAAAAVHGLSDIYICENGILSLNVPISDARKGSRSTRHAHPLYLLYFNQLINTLYEYEFNVQNPFFFWTKGEEAKLLLKTRLYSVIKNTVSCWGYPNQTLRYPNSNHCGYCIPCIVRRVSLLAAGLEKCDDQYVVDVFNLDGSTSEKYLRNIEDLAYFCKSFATLSKTELLYRYPELVMVEVGPNPSYEDRVTKIIAVYKKFSEEFMSVAKRLNPKLLQAGFQAVPASV
jgi:7-cyano-7-deazaguanine synthase in queuosine biosynthesis